MKRLFTIVLLFSSALLVLTADAFARGGGGGARRDGGSPARSAGGNRRPSPAARDVRPDAQRRAPEAGERRVETNNFRNRATTAGERSRNLNEHLGIAEETRRDFQREPGRLQAQEALRHEPFSRDWYADHPRAWRHPHADAWAAGSLAAANAWLGVPVYTTDDTSSETEYADESTTEPTAEEAATLAQTGAGDVNDAEWLSLGVYSLAPRGQKDDQHLMQIAVSKEGVLRGSYYDVVTDEAQTLQGAVDKTTRRAAWTVGADDKVVFHTSLDDLTQATGPLSAHLPDGEVKQWDMTRFENP